MKYLLFVSETLTESVFEIHYGIAGVTKTRSETAERETPKTRNSGAKRSQKFSGPFRSLGARGLTKMRNHRRETVNVSGSVVSALLKVNYLLT